MTLFPNDAAQRPVRSTYKNESTVYENHNCTYMCFFKNNLDNIIINNVLSQLDCNVNK